MKECIKNNLAPYLFGLSTGLILWMLFNFTDSLVLKIILILKN